MTWWGEMNGSCLHFHNINVPPCDLDLTMGSSGSCLSSEFKNQEYSPRRCVRTRSISVAKIWGSERRIRSGVFVWSPGVCCCCSIKYLRLKTFLRRPSMFQVMAVKDDDGGVREEEAADDASTNGVELSDVTSLN